MTITEFLTARLADPIGAGDPNFECFGAGEYHVCEEWSEWHRRTVAALRAIIHQHGSNDGAHECPDGFMDGAETEPHTGWELECMTQRHLAAVYSDHPDYREEWKP